MFKKIIENTYQDTLNNLLDIYFYKKTWNEFFRLFRLKENLN